MSSLQRGGHELERPVDVVVVEIEVRDGADVRRPVGRRQRRPPPRGARPAPRRAAARAREVSIWTKFVSTRSSSTGTPAACQPSPSRRARSWSTASSSTWWSSAYSAAAATIPACRMAPPKRNFWRHATSIRSAGPASTAPSGQPSPFERQSVTVSTRDPTSAGGTPSATAAFIIRAPSMCTPTPAGPRDRDDGIELGERPHASAGDVVGVLDDEHGRALVDHVLGGRARRAHLRRREPAADAGQRRR